MTEPRQIKLSIISIWIGVLIPIIAAIIPYGYKYLSPEHDLVFELVGPISVKGTKSVSIKVSNRGEKVEKDVKVWLKTEPSFLQLETVLSKEKPKDPLSYLTIDTTAPATAKKENDSFVISVGDIRPKETIELSIASGAISLWRVRDAYGISVKSEEHLARLSGPSDFETVAYPFGFWMFIILMVLLLFAGLYQEYLMDPKKREEWLLKEIDKLSKK